MPTNIQLTLALEELLAEALPASSPTHAVKQARALLTPRTCTSCEYVSHALPPSCAWFMRTTTPLPATAPSEPIACSPTIAQTCKLYAQRPT